MGDIADYMVEQMINREVRFHSEPRDVTCKFCGKTGLRWHEGQQWALVTKRGAIHDCRGAADPDEFSVVE